MSQCCCGETITYTDDKGKLCENVHVIVKAYIHPCTGKCTIKAVQEMICGGVGTKVQYGYDLTRLLTKSQLDGLKQSMVSHSQD